jgi:hypothetical protein
MSVIPTRWKTTFHEQLDDASRRIETAERQLAAGDGGRALQATYPAVVAAATVRVWLDAPPWERPLPPHEMQAKVRGAFPSRFAALAVLDLRDVLTSPWTAEAAGPYVDEARAFVQQTQEQVATWLGQA